MLIKSKLGDRTLVTSKPLLTSVQQGYIRPGPGKAWFQTTTTVWRVDDLIRRSVRDWRRLTGETGHTGTRAETMRKDHNSLYTGTNSVFPAPLVEWILLRYGGPPGGLILDAFAGGPPRAVVAALMGYNYVGVDIRQEQIDENIAVLEGLNLTGVEYVLGDGCYLEDLPENSFDCAATCPPYWNLEQYSDLETDLSNLATYSDFNASMLRCAKSHYPLMKPGAFVCIVVGNFRDKGDKNGELIDFRGHTVGNFKEAGFLFWQDITLSKNFASAATRAGNAWRGKKLVPAAESLLIFRKPGWDEEKGV